MAWQSSTINPATTSPATDISKITNDLAVLKGVIGGTNDAAVPVSFTNLSWTGTLTGGTGVINIGSGQFYKDASGNIGIGGAPTNGGKLEIAGVTANQMNAVFSHGVSDQNYQLWIRNGDAGSATGTIQATLGLAYSGVTDSCAALKFARGSGTADGVIQLWTNSTQQVSLDNSNGFLVRNTIGIGYGAGSGGTVTQATSKSTSVTLNKPAGRITMNNAALAAGATVSFTVNNSILGAADVVLPTFYASFSGSQNYNVWAANNGGGSFSIILKNISAGSLSDAVDLNFVIIKGASA